MFRIGIAVAAVEQLPVGIRRVHAAYLAQGHARFLYLAPLGADILAFLVFQGGEELLEIRVAGIEPVKLHATTHQVAGFFQLVRFAFRREQDVAGRHLAGLLLRLQEGQQGGACLAIAGQQARAAHRRKGNSGQQFRVVFKAMLLIRVGPGPVEHVFAIRVQLQVQGQGGGQGLALPQHQVIRLPARVCAGAAGLVQRVQEGIGEEGSGVRLAGQQFRPGRFANFSQGRDDSRAIIHCCSVHSSLSGRRRRPARPCLV